MSDSERRFYDGIRSNRKKFLVKLRKSWDDFKKKYLQTLQKAITIDQRALFQDVLKEFGSIAEEAFEEGVAEGNRYFEGTFRVRGLTPAQQKIVVDKQVRIFRLKAFRLYFNDARIQLNKKPGQEESVLTSFDRFLLGYSAVAINVAYEIFARNTSLLNNSLFRLFSLAGKDFPRQAVKVRWRLFEGAKHSGDCLRMREGKDGTGIWDARELAETGFLPGSSQLDCGGNCRCHLSPFVPLNAENAAWLQNVTELGARKDILSIVTNISGPALGKFFDQREFKMSNIIKTLIISQTFFRRIEFFNRLQKGGLTVAVRQNQPKFAVTGETKFIRRARKAVPASITLDINLPRGVTLDNLQKWHKDMIISQLAHEIGHTVAVFDPATGVASGVLGLRKAQALIRAANTERATALVQIQDSFIAIIKRIPKRKLTPELRRDIQLINNFIQDPDDFVERLFDAVIAGGEFGGIPAIDAYKLLDRVLLQYSTGTRLTRGYQLYTVDEYFAEWFSLLLTNPSQAALFSQRLNKAMATEFRDFFQTAQSRRARTLLPTSTASGFRTDLPRPSGFTPLGPNLISFAEATSRVTSATPRITTITVRRQIEAVIKNVPNMHRREFFENMKVTFLDKFQMAQRTGSRQHVGFFENGEFFINYDKWRPLTLNQRSEVFSDIIARNVWKQSKPVIKTKIRRIYADYIERAMGFMENKAGVQFQRELTELTDLKLKIFGGFEDIAPGVVNEIPRNISFFTRNFETTFRPIFEKVSDLPIINIESLRNPEAFFIEWTKLFMSSPGHSNFYEPLLRTTLEDFLRVSPIRKLLEV